MDSPVQQEDSQRLRAGYAFALAAYAFWGFAPMYFVLVGFAAPLEVLAYRVVWSIPLLVILITLARQWPSLRTVSRRKILLLVVCAILLSVNWFTFIYAVQAQRISEAALGYFINPLVSIVLGWAFLSERLRPWQWAAVAVAAGGVCIELLALGELPWLGLVLAFSFGFYGLLRKQLAVPSSIGLGIETMIIAPIALAYLVYTAKTGLLPERTFDELMWLGLGGLVTVTPLIWFASAAIRLPLSTLGLFQYLAPTISLLLAVFVYEEPVTSARWIGLSLIWFGLLMVYFEALYHHKGAFLRTKLQGYDG